MEADALAREVLSTSGIEGEILDPDQVRSCVAARLGLDAGKSLRPIPAVEGIVRIMVDATARYREGTDRRTPPRLALMALPQRQDTGSSGSGPELAHRAGVGRLRDHVGRERVHFEGPEPERVPGEMSAFLEWFNRPPETDGVIRAGTAHLWFVAVHSPSRTATAASHGPSPTWPWPGPKAAQCGSTACLTGYSGRGTRTTTHWRTPHQGDLRHHRLAQTGSPGASAGPWTTPWRRCLWRSRTPP